MRTQAAVLLALAVASARAGDPPPADSIAAAKKDFAQIRASTAATDGVSAFPSLDVKDLGPGPGGPQPAPTPLPMDKDPSLDPTKKKTGTGNWLVDAMDKDAEKERKADRDRPHAFVPGEDFLKTDTELLMQENEKAGEHGAKASASEARDKDAAKEAPESVYNPLTAFMGGWISARDHDLLLPASKSDADSGKARVDPMPGPDAGQPAAFSDVFLPAPDASGWSDSRAASNPYLAVVDPEPPSALKVFSAPEAPGFAPIEFPDSPRGSVFSGVDPRPLDGSRTFIPDFAQPSEDDKYFKQMKRF